MSKSNDLLGAMVVGAVVAAIIIAPNVYRSYTRMIDNQREFMEIELKTLKSEYGVCDVLMKGDRKDLQDIMREVCDDILVRQAELNKKLGN